MTSTTKGVIWSAIERFSVQGVSFVLGLIIARLVTPGEYGLIAMIAIFIAIAQTFIDSGFGSALIQKKDRNEVDYSTVFYFNIVISIILYCILYFCSPVISKFYDQPVLTNVTRFIGLNLIISSFSIIQRTRLNIELNFKLQAKVSLVAVLISGVLGIFFAYKGWGVWALVIQSLSNNFFSTIFLWITTKWTPILKFSFVSFRKLFSFGSKLLASGLLNTIYLNLYSLVIGKFYNASDVGYYNRAYSISQYPSTNIVTIITRVIYPVQCANQDDDNWLENSFLKYLRISCFIVFPLMILLCVISIPLIDVVLTDKWLPAAKLLSILSIAYMLYPIMVMNTIILNVKGRSDLFLKAEIIKKILAVLVLCVTLPFGIDCLCWGILFYNVLDIIVIIAFLKRIFKTDYYTQIRAVFPIFGLSVVTGLLTWVAMLVIKASWFKLLIGIVIFMLSYLLIAKFLKISEVSQIKKMLNLNSKYVSK